MVSFHGFIGFGEIMNVIILMCAAYSMNFCCMIIYIIFMLNDVVTYFATVGLAVQENFLAKCYRENNFEKNGCDSFSMTMLIVFFLFAIIATYVAFKAYRVFKALAMGMLEGGL